MSTVLAFRFPAGRYHATPWGSHANEAEVEWPPSPWRILRMLIAVWHRKVDPEHFPEEALSRLIERLCSSEPLYRLPAMTTAHARHYMPVRSSAGDRPVLIFDAFARVDSEDELIVAWPDVSLEKAERDLLGTLLDRAGYLGRAESWIDARLLDTYDGSFNCAPAAQAHLLDPCARRAPVRLLVPIPAAEYAEWRSRSVTELGLDAKRLARRQKRILTTLPPRLTGALSLDTGDLRDAEWNLPPGGRMVMYERPRSDVLKRTRSLRETGREKHVTTARLTLAGKPLPRIEDSVRMGELVRVASISAANRVGGGAPVPAELSGHGAGDDLNHRHAFYLPEDADGDGFIDHVVIHAPGGLTRHSVTALDDLPRKGLWMEDGARWAVVFEGAWERAADSGSMYGAVARTWVSVTPYLRPWFAKPRFGTEEQIRRECEERRLPMPETVRVLPSIRVGGRERRPVHFHRFRSKAGLRQPDSHGSMVELVFAEPVTGPLALGFGCHYGLGMFAPSPTRINPDRLVTASSLKPRVE